jgi:endoglycosylceramidase
MRRSRADARGRGIRARRPAHRHPLWADQLGGAPRLRLLLLMLPLAIAAWLVLPVPALSAFVPAPDRPPAQPGLPWLSTAGGRIVDSAGRTVTLHGFDDDTLLEPTQYPGPLTASDAALIEAAGFDLVRLPIAWSALEPRRGQFSAAYLDRIAGLVQMLNAHRLYVVLDMHFLGWSPAFGGSGAPAWATLGWVPDVRWGPMPSVTRLLSPAINASTAYFWLTQDWQEQYLAAWRFVAQRFRDDSGVAGYDIINEPHAFPLPPLRFDKDQLFPFYARAVSSLGAVDPNHLFILECDALGDLPTSVVPLRAPDLVYSPHLYTGVLFPPAFDGNPSAIDTHVAELAREARQVPAPMWVGELGIGSNAPDATGWAEAALDALDAHGSGWAWWQWRGGYDPHWAIRSRDGRSLDLTMLRILARPYLAAAPAGVSASGSDGVEGRLNVSVAQAHGAGVIEVAWSRLTLGAPRLRSSCAVTASWEAPLARLMLSVPASVACSITLSAA